MVLRMVQLPESKGLVVTKAVKTKWLTPGMISVGVQSENIFLIAK